MDMRLLLLLLLAGCTSVDPWRHFPAASARPGAPPGVIEQAQPAAVTGHAVPSQDAARSPGARRSSPASIARMPAPPAPAAAVPVPALPPAPQHAGPQPLIGCQGDACNTPQTRVQGGTGNVFLEPGGRTCHAHNGWLQCF